MTPSSLLVCVESETGGMYAGSDCGMTAANMLLHEPQAVLQALRAGVAFIIIVITFHDMP